MKISKGKLIAVGCAMAIAIAVPLGWAALKADRETFMYVVLAECLTISAGAFALPLWALWKTKDIKKKD